MSVSSEMPFITVSIKTRVETDYETGAWMAIIGYARVSTTDQNPHLQLDALQEAGAARVFCATG
jgi:hypothetical protein